MTEKKVHHDEIELRSEEFQEILGAVPSWILRRGITLLAAVIAILLVGSAFFSYPDTIPASMILTGANPASAIKARTTGKIKELYVTDKQEVKAGDFLAVLENPAHTGDISMLKQYIETMNPQMDTIIRLPSKDLDLGSIQSIYSGFYTAIFEYNEFIRLKYYTRKIDFMKKRIGQHQVYLRKNRDQQSIVSTQLLLYRNQYRRDSTLYANKLISEEMLEGTRNTYLQGSLSLENMNSTILNTEMQIVQMQEGLLDTEYQYLDQKNQLETRLKTYAGQLLAEIQAWELTYALIAPTDGQVDFTSYWAINQNVTTGETILHVIPHTNEEMIGKAQIAVARSGKVRSRQRVNIRFANFPDNEYGIIKGKVRNISLVPVKNNQGEAYYTAEIELPDGLNTTYGKALPYLPEMEAQVDIITEDISLLERLFMPIRKIWTEGIL